MSEKVKILIIGAGPSAQEMAVISKTIAKQLGVTTVEFNRSFEDASVKMQKVYELQSKSIQNFALTVNKIKSLGHGSSQKSKYINKPRNNYKKR